MKITTISNIKTDGQYCNTSCFYFNNYDVLGESVIKCGLFPQSRSVKDHKELFTDWEDPHRRILRCVNCFNAEQRYKNRQKPQEKLNRFREKV